MLLMWFITSCNCVTYLKQRTKAWCSEVYFVCRSQLIKLRVFAWLGYICPKPLPPEWFGIDSLNVLVKWPSCNTSCHFRTVCFSFVLMKQGLSASIVKKKKKKKKSHIVRVSVYGKVLLNLESPTWIWWIGVKQIYFLFFFSKKI